MTLFPTDFSGRGENDDIVISDETIEEKHTVPRALAPLTDPYTAVGDSHSGLHGDSHGESTSFTAPKTRYYGPRSVIKSTMSPEGLPCLTPAEIKASASARGGGCSRVVPTGTPVDPASPAQPARAAPAAPAPEPIVITSTDVTRLMVDGSGITRQPPGTEVLINLDAIVYTSDDPRTLTTEVNGTPVTVKATPTSYTWSWGDGSSTTTTDPGAAYPNQTVTHHYASTAQDVSISLTTTWDATFTPEGQDTQPVTGTITTRDTTPPFDVVRTISYLTDDAEEAQGH